MYKGFDCRISLEEFGLTPQQIKEVVKLETIQQSKYNTIIREKMDSFLTETGIIDGTGIMENWFPSLDADVFISHSHKDKNLALILAAFLYEWFGLKVFIDWAVWGNIDELSTEIDEALAYDDDSDDDTANILSLRSNISSHINMMLANSLGMMIDKCECLLFLNTPQSISLADAIEKTSSPWIFHEISISQIIRKINRRIRTVNLSESKRKVFSAESQCQFVYGIDKTHLQVMDIDKMNDWIEKYDDAENHQHALDCLYSIYPK